jgi:F0F1-type ATP synthase membrane subunit b/b'
MAKSTLTGLALVTLAALSAPAFADKCADDIQEIEKALASQDLSPDIRAQLEDMKKQAQQLCAAGHKEEGLDVTGEAKALLNLN